MGRLLRCWCCAATIVAFGCTTREPVQRVQTAPALARTPPLDCETVPAPYENLAPVLEPLRQTLHLPALGAAVVSPDGVKALGVVGYRKYGDPTKACVGDAFHLGSDAKAMTAVVIAKLVEGLKLSWTTKAHDALTDVRDQDTAYANVTLDQLLAHRAGLAHDPTSVTIDELRRLEGSMHERREAYARIALREPPAHEPGTSYAYSNTGYVLAGLMAEQVTGEAWEDLVRETLFVPLKMTGAGFGLTATPGHVDGLWAHDMKDGVPVPVEPSPRSDNPIFRTPAGSVHVSMEGWGRFIVDVLRGFEGTGVVLARESYAHLHTPPFGGTYAYGWTLVDRSWAGGVVYTHGGSNTLNFAVAWVAPKRRLAVLVATNVGTDVAAHACDDVVGVLLRRELRLPE